METTFEQEMQQVRDERTYQENLRNSIINHEQKMARYEVYKTMIIALACILIAIIVMNSFFIHHQACNNSNDCLKRMIESE